MIDSKTLRKSFVRSRKHPVSKNGGDWLRFFLFLFFFAIFGNASAAEKGFVFVEAESFAVKGGWIVDQQYMDVMGSPVLLAHGMGVPVADAETTVVFPKSGVYRVFVRTRNWAAPWTDQDPPGRFRLLVDGKALETVFGTEGKDWHWQSGGTVEIRHTEVKLALRDLTGFDGRADALVFLPGNGTGPPEDAKTLEAFRRRALGLPATPLEAPKVAEDPFDLVVVGGGIPGMCTALSAARLGCRVALIQNRPLLGGNNSSEVRVDLSGRVGYPPYPNLGNLVHEMDPHQDGNAKPGEEYQDHKKMDIVRAEKKIALYLNTHVVAVETVQNSDGSIKILSVVGRNIETGRETKFPGTLFADCTGDASVGFLAGAEWRMGRESREQTGESLAPDRPDEMTLGASVQWYAVPAVNEKGEPVKTDFPVLPWAHRFTDESARPTLVGAWNWETGYSHDQIEQIEWIRDNGLRAAYGHWDYMKNQSPPEWRKKVDCMKLGWVSFIAGKRESRRLIGDVVLKEQDILERKEWPDACVVTNWPIDLHYPHPDNARFFPGEEFRAKDHHTRIHPYAIPYRILYSKNVSNLFMAGRCVSVTHVALGTTRVMRTCGMMGEVVGMAASIALKHGGTPRDVYARYLPELIELMKKGVAPKPDKYWHSGEPRYPKKKSSGNEM